MTLFTLVNIYNEAETLERALLSVEAAFSSRIQDFHHVIVDGRYPDHPGDSMFSTDDTPAIASRVGTYLQVHADECAKRTAGLRFIDTVAQEGDFVLYLDADETITSIFCLPARVGYIDFTRKTHREINYGRCRLYRWEPGLYFANRHYDLYDASGDLVASLEDAPSFDVVGHGNHYEKPRTEAKKAYYSALRLREGHPAEVPA